MGCYYSLNPSWSYYSPSLGTNENVDASFANDTAASMVEGSLSLRWH